MSGSAGSWPEEEETQTRAQEREEKVHAGAVIDDLCMCSIMIPVVACIALSELNTHIIKTILSVPKCVPKSQTYTHFGTLSQPRYNTHSMPPRTALDVREHRYSESTAARREPCRWRCRASRTFQQMAKAACVSCDFGTHFGTHFGTPHRD